MNIVHELRQIHSALDSALGDTDVTHIESEEDLLIEEPFQWAAMKLAQVIAALDADTDDTEVLGRCAAIYTDEREGPNT